MNRRKLTSRLRQLGFIKADQTRVTYTSGRVGTVLTYERERDGFARVEVQLWPNGSHRVIRHDQDGVGGYPIEFKSTNEMERAIAKA